MLSSVSLIDFKSFERLDQLEIRPITILCGSNSSGKSSILKSILSVKQSFESEVSRNSLLLNGHYVNNGKFRDVIHNGEDGSFMIKNSFSVRRGKDKFNQDSFSFKTLDKIYKKVASSINRFDLDYEINVVEKDSNSPNKKMLLDNILQSCAIRIKPYGNQQFNSQAATIALEKHKNQDYEYTLSWKTLPNQMGETSSDSIPCTCYFSGLQLINIYALDNAYGKIYDVLPNIISIFQILSQQYDNISYIGPLREAPARRYIFEEENNDIGTKGENAPLILSNENYLIKRSLMLNSDEPLTFDTKDLYFKELVFHWLNYLGIEDVSIEEKDDVLRLLIEGNSIADVGFGISQALPIIVGGVNLQKDQSLILEQPEIHLHPKMQMRITDFFISMALSGKQFIIETHSDHIINRLVRRIMEDKNNQIADLVKIYFVEKKHKISTVDTIKVDKVKGVENWPKDFFDQYANETEKMVHIGFENLKSKNLGR
jgi:Uncharacterized conserved protein